MFADSGSCRPEVCLISPIYRLAIDFTLNVATNGSIRSRFVVGNDAVAKGVETVVRFLTSDAVLEDAWTTLSTPLGLAGANDLRVGGSSYGDVNVWRCGGDDEVLREMVRWNGV